MLGLRRGSSVEEPAEYGHLAKSASRHLATREAALVDVARGASIDLNLQVITERFEASFHVHRPYIDRVEKMSRGVQGINLRVGQDFESDMQDLIQIVGTEIEWELGEALPAIKGSLQRPHVDEQSKSAEHISTHAPTNLDPERPRWRERALHLEADHRLRPPEGLSPGSRAQPVGDWSVIRRKGQGDAWTASPTYDAEHHEPMVLCPGPPPPCRVLAGRRGMWGCHVVAGEQGARRQRTQLVLHIRMADLCRDRGGSMVAPDPRESRRTSRSEAGEGGAGSGGAQSRVVDESERSRTWRGKSAATADPIG